MHFAFPALTLQFTKYFNITNGNSRRQRDGEAARGERAIEMQSARRKERENIEDRNSGDKIRARGE